MRTDPRDKKAQSNRRRGKETVAEANVQVRLMCRLKLVWKWKVDVQAEVEADVEVDEVTRVCTCNSLFVWTKSICEERMEVVWEVLVLVLLPTIPHVLKQCFGLLLANRVVFYLIETHSAT